jgi:hypothetical protein
MEPSARVLGILEDGHAGVEKPLAKRFRDVWPYGQNIRLQGPPVLQLLSHKVAVDVTTVKDHHDVDAGIGPNSVEVRR